MDSFDTVLRVLVFGVFVPKSLSLASKGSLALHSFYRTHRMTTRLQPLVLAFTLATLGFFSGVARSADVSGFTYCIPITISNTNTIYY